MTCVKDTSLMTEAGVIGQGYAMKIHRVTDNRLALICKANIPVIVCTGDKDQ
jgi:hypothetical protein